MSLEQTIRDTVMSESMDMDARLQQLVRAGLMPQNTLPLLRKSIAKVQGGMSLQGPERDVMATFINSMMYIVLGDDTIFNKARAGAKNYATEEVELDENAKIVAHLKKRYGDNIRKSHVMSAAKDFGVDASKLSKAVRKHLGKTMLEAKEKQEYDYEGDMAMSQLKSIIANSQRMHDSMSEDTNLPEWVQSKITLAEDYITTAANYMQGEMSEAVGDITVKKISAADAYKKHTGQMTKKTKVPVDPKTGKTLYQKITSEEVETIDEISTNLAISYRGKAGEDKTKDRSKGRKLALDKWSGKAKVPSGKYNEEVEQIDELSKKTLGNYVKKAAGHAAGSAAATAAIASSSNPKVPEKTKRDLRNRMKGISKATDKIVKEDIDAVKKMNESYKTAFDAALIEYNIKSPSELGEEKRKEFFNYVDQEFKKGDQ